MTKIQKLSLKSFDLIEFGVSGVTKKEIEIIRKNIKKPLILAARGEKLTVTTAQRYLTAIKNNWDWIDIDVKSSPLLLGKILREIEKAHKQKMKTKFILSLHDSTSTISTRMITDWIEKMRKMGKNIPTLPKVVTKIVEWQDMVRIRNIALSYTKRKIGIILHGSGENSRESRMLQAIAGSAITYLCLSKKLATAKGQWTIEEWNRTIRAL